jgi:SOS-response transcriptional repressor LexA
MRRRVINYDECLEKIMSPVQREVFLIVDEWWKKWGHSPTLRQIADIRGKSGVGNTKEIVDRLVKLGVLKRIERKRSIRPVYINFRNLE